MEFKKYMHVERFGNDEVEGIDIGKCYVFPKIDGTNGSVWVGKNLNICAGSRNRKLTIESDNAGFMKAITNDKNIQRFMSSHPDVRLYGEWLVPHSLKTYRDESWRNFYVFDVYDEINERYMEYDVYSQVLEEYLINYIPPISVINNPTIEQLYNQLSKNNFLIKDGEGIGEGIVIKNYEYKNKFGRTVWAKIVTSEFKEKHTKTLGAPELEGKKKIEEEIVKNYCTDALINKTLEKIRVECDGWTSKYIPRLLNTVFYELIKEESWNFLKEHKFPSVDFRRLQQFVNIKIKKTLPELF